MTDTVKSVCAVYVRETACSYWVLVRFLLFMAKCSIYRHLAFMVWIVLISMRCFYFVLVGICRLVLLLLEALCLQIYICARRTRENWHILTLTHPKATISQRKLYWLLLRPIEMRNATRRFGYDGLLIYQYLQLSSFLCSSCALLSDTNLKPNPNLNGMPSHIHYNHWNCINILMAHV